MWGFSMLGSGSSSLAFLSWLDWLGSTFSEMRLLYVRLVSPLRLTAYDFHWFAMAYRRYIDSSARPDGWMAIALIFLSVLGVDVFRRAGDIPVMLSLSA